MTTLYWHDYETFGVDPARTRASQFAGVRTDEELNVIGEPLMIYCKPDREMLPAPLACLITGITPQQAEQKGLPEREFIKKIHAELSVPGTCGVGYNSLRFDDEVTRYTLYRNFYDPYEREWQNGNSRWDIIDMFRLARALRPEGINWPDYENGSPCFKLEELTRANGLAHEAAHDALSDVYATIALAKLLKDKQPRLFNYLYQNRTKKNTTQLIDVLNKKPFLHVSSRLPRENGYVALMMPLRIHPVNRNEILCVNLNSDLGGLLDWDAERIRQRLYVHNEDLAEGEQRIPLKGVHVNKCPVVVPPKLLNKEIAQRLQIDLDKCRDNWRQLSTVDLQEKLSEVYSAGFDRPEGDVETQLYSRFLPNRDKNLLVEVRRSSPDELAANRVNFQDKRYQQLLFRYRARNFPQSLSEQELHQWEEFRFQRLTDGSNGYLSLEQYFQQIDSCLADEALTQPQRNILQALQEWGEQIL